MKPTTVSCVGRTSDLPTQLTVVGFTKLHFPITTKYPLRSYRVPLGVHVPPLENQWSKMSSVPKSLRGGAKYGICSHLKPPYLRWDPHEVCVACTASPKMESAMIDYVHGGVPTCRYCRQMSREDRKRWIYFIWLESPYYLLCTL